MAALRGNNDDEEQGDEENLRRALIELENNSPNGEKLYKRGRFLYSKRYHFDDDFIPDEDNNSGLSMSKRRYLRSKRSV
jgi:hypothetical protein